MHVKLITTMIHVTHDQVEAMTMADKIVAPNAGRIEQADSPAQLHAKPANRFVAGCIGSPRMTLIDGTLAAKPEAAAIGVRPEHLRSDTLLHVNADERDRLTAHPPGELGARSGEGSASGLARDA